MLKIFNLKPVRFPMKNLTKLSDKDLLISIDESVKLEKAQTIIVLRHLQEINRRRLFAELGYSSLFCYCNEHLKYSKAESYLRIQAMKLLKDVPLVEKKLESGSLTLTQAGELFSYFKENSNLSIEDKTILINKVENQSTRETEKILAIPEAESETKFKNLKLNEKLFNELTKLARELKIDDPAQLVKLLVKEKTDELKSAKAIESKANNSTSTRHVPAQIKRDLLKQANYQCEFITKDGKRCSEKIYLEVEHTEPYSFSGRTEFKALKILCKSHNLRSAINVFGLKKMDRYIN